MQCISAKRGQSSSASSLSEETLNKYFARKSNRKSFLRRSFDVVRKSVVRRSEYLSRRSFKADPNENHFDIDDHNNNANMLSKESLFINAIANEENTYDGENILIFSTNCDIAESNEKKQQYPNKR